MCNGEGEQTFASLLGQLASGRPDPTAVRGLSFWRDGTLITTERQPKLATLDAIPSPFLTGLFEPGRYSGTVLETNRGCPFTCSFCTWGGPGTEVAKFDQTRVEEEISWIARAGIYFLYLADANWGMLPRDIDLSRHIARCNHTYRSPGIVTYAAAKNKPQGSVQCIEILHEAGLSTSQAVGVQSMTDSVLANIRRTNIRTAKFVEMYDQLAKRGISSYSELMWPLPGETLATLRQNVARLCEMGTTCVIVYPVLLINNAELTERRDEFALVTMPSPNPADDADIVVATREVDRDECLRGMWFFYAVHALYNTKSLEHLSRYLHLQRIVTYDALFAAFADFCRSRPTYDFARCCTDMLARFGHYDVVSLGELAHHIMHEKRSEFARLLCDFVGSCPWGSRDDVRALLAIDLVNRPYIYADTPLAADALPGQHAEVIATDGRAMTVQWSEPALALLAETGLVAASSDSRRTIVDHRQSQLPLAGLERRRQHLVYCHGMIERARQLLPRWRVDPRAARGPASGGAANGNGAAPDVPLRRQTEALASDQVVPLSFLQQRLWFLNHLRPNSSHYNLSDVLRLRGDLDVKALAAAVDAVVARHEALRTTFVAQGGDPSQQVQAPRPGLLQIENLAGDAAAQRQRLVAHARQAFDLEHDLPLRALLLRVGEHEHVLHLVAHHIAVDGWSISVLREELAECYAAFRAGRSPQLQDNPWQCQDFALWQRERLGGAALARELTFWRRELAALPPALELPSDRPRPPEQTFAGARLVRELPQSLATAITRLSTDHGATPFMTLIAAFATLLHRYTGRTDLVLGTPVAARNRVELERMIGALANTLVLRFDLASNPTFVDLLRRTRERVLAALTHQELPFEKLVGELQPERDLSHHPLVQVVFAVQNNPRAALALPGLEVIAEPVETGTSRYDLAVGVVKSGDVYQVEAEFNTDLFDRSTIDRLLRHYQRLLAAIAADPQRPLSALALLDAAERAQLQTFGRAPHATLPDRCVHAGVEAWAARDPHRLAVKGAGQELTYGDLNARANQLARALRARGVGPGTLIAVCLERSTGMVVAQLAVLKAGGAYIPLDPREPAERLATLLVEAGTPLVVTQASLLQHLPVDAPLVVLDRDAHQLDAHATEDSAPLATLDDLAYVIFTSGSTGKPKGVPIRHRGLANLLAWHQRTYAVKPDDRASHIAGLSFDAAVWELWPYLSAGAAVCLADDETRLSPEKLLAWLAAERITLAFVPTPLAELVLELPPPPGLVLRAMLTGGDRLRRAPPPGLPYALVNHYGPTEGTVVATYARVEPGLSGPPPIGRPVDNVEVMVADTHGQMLPIGVPGELLLGGVGLAPGYLGDAALTAERFVLHPTAGESGTSQGARARWFRTGDLVRWRSDGQLEFLGRLGQQVKVRGFRIELGEIEAALMAHASIRAAAVVLVGSEPAQRLVAHLVLDPGATLDRAELRVFLTRRLPHYMAPAELETLPALPLTAAGKVDRAALAAASAPDSTAAATATAPRDPLETKLAAIWQRLLARSTAIGIHDDFFQIGGNSLLAVRLFHAIDHELGRRLPTTVLFHAPTIEQLAEAIRTTEAPAGVLGPVAIHAGGTRLPLFCVPASGASAIMLRDLALALGPDQPVYGLEAVGLQGDAEPHDRVEAIAAHNLRAIRQVQPHGPYFLAGHCFGGIVAFEMAQQLRDHGERVALLAVLDTLAAPGQPLPVPRHYRWLRHLPGPWGVRVFRGLRRLQLLLTLTPPVPMGPAARRVNDAHVQARRVYVPRVYPGTLDLFQSQDGARLGSDRAWQQLAGGGFQLHRVAASHVNALLRQPHAGRLAQQLRERLAGTGSAP